MTTLKDDFENVECQNESPEFNKTMKPTQTFDLIKNIERELNLNNFDRGTHIEQKIC